MPFLTAANKTILRKMNTSANRAGLGDLLGVNLAAAGTFTTVAGSPTQTISVPGAVATDVVNCTVRVVGGTPRTIVSAIAAANAITVVMSGDPAADHVLNFTAIRLV